LWRNRQTEAHLVLRPKSRNCRGDFETKITKPKLPVLRPKSGNPPPPWFLGSTKKPTTGFEAKPGEIITTIFEAKLEKTITAGFEAKPLETVVADFEAKPLETIAADFKAKPLETIVTDFEVKPTKIIRVVFRPNHSQTITISFEAQTDEKSSEWLGCHTTHKPLPSVLRPKPMRNRPSGFVVKPLINRRPWFLCSIKKLALLVSTCTVQTAHSVTRSLDRPATEYPTCAPIPGPLN
jgi:hypothetical protein